MPALATITFQRSERATYLSVVAKRTALCPSPVSGNNFLRLLMYVVRPSLIGVKSLGMTYVTTLLLYSVFYSLTLGNPLT